MRLSNRFGVLAVTGVIASVTIATVAWAGPGSGPARPSVDRAVAQRSAPPYQPDSELAYVPVDPCQVVNTGRLHKKLAKKATRTYVVAGSAGFATQGGNAHGCRVPTSAVAVSLNLLATKATKSGTVAVSPGDKQPKQVFLAYRAKHTVTAGLTLRLGPSPSAGIRVHNAGRKTTPGHH